MDEAQVERRLAAILVADIAGYTRLMAEDEAATVAVLKGHQAVVLPLVEAHGGRIQDTAGDGILTEFRSVLQAVECAVAIQNTMAERNAEVPPARQMRFRIGVNFGDVMYDGARVYGDGLNIAARIQALAEPGGICVTALVREEVGARTSLAFEDLGDQSLKNFPRPVRVFHVRLDARGKPGATPRVAPRGAMRARRRPVLVGALALLLIGLLGLGVRLALDRKPPLDRPRLSIAVLPFSNLSGDPGQDYFSDSLTEDLTTDLSRIEGAFVIARNTMQTHRGKAVDVRQLGRELGVRYILEGSVRRAESQVRVNAQLIDAETGAHLWAERFDRGAEDLFALQSEVTGQIASALNFRLKEAENQRATRGRPQGAGTTSIGTGFSESRLIESALSVHISTQSPTLASQFANTVSKKCSYQPGWVRICDTMSFVPYSITAVTCGRMDGGIMHPTLYLCYDTLLPLGPHSLSRRLAPWGTG